MSPRRPFPVHVYLFAVALYELTDMSQRKAAHTTAKLFVLDSFSASTLCRARKRFSACENEILEAAEADDVNIDIDNDDEVVSAVVMIIQDNAEDHHTKPSSFCEFNPLMKTSKTTLKDVFSSFSWIQSMIECVSSGRRIKSLLISFASDVGKLVRKFYNLFQRLLI
jgi:hypothetical protein